MKSPRLGFLKTLAQDIRYGWRGLLRLPNFTIPALLALMLGIGSTTATFSVVDRLLFRSLPYPDGERLVSFGVMAPLDTSEFVLSADWPEWRAAATTFESVTTFTPAEGVCDLADDNPTRVSCVSVEATFLKTFGIPPLIGRDFTSDEDRPKGPRAAIISYRLWQSRFGGSSPVTGRRITVDGAPTTIIGVLPRDFEMPSLTEVDLLLPQQLPFVAHPNSGRPLRAFGRLKPGVTVQRAEAALLPMFRQSLQWVPEGFRKEVTLRVRSLRDRQVRDVRLASLLLFGSVLGVMLIACANVSNLLLARAASRTREFAVRSAIGASHGRLVQQALTESLVLALAGGTFGCGLAALLVRLMIHIAPAGIPRLEQASIDMRTLLFASGVSAVSALIFGITPTLFSPSAEALAHRGSVSTRSVLRHCLVTAQIALSLVLLTSAGLLIRSLWNLQTVPLGLRTENVIVSPISLRQQSYGSPQQQRLFFEQLESQLRSLPGLGDVAISDSVPLGGPVSDITGRLGTRSTLFASIQIEGRPALDQGTGGLVAWRRVTPDYFRVLGIPIVRGRGFEEEDRQPDRQVIIVSEALARRLFPNEDAVGKWIRIGGLQNPFKTIVGVARDAKNNPGLSAPDDPEYYVPRRHDDVEGGSPQAAVILRTSMDTTAATNAIRSIVAGMDPALPVTAYPMQRRLNELAARPRFNAVLLGSFAATGLLLAAIGLYGVVSFLTVQRIPEIGVRMALGATGGNIIKLVFLGAMRWTLLGIAAGLAGSFFATQLLRTLLFDVSARDLWTLFVATALMLTVAGIAALLPSRRAARTDPIIALRQSRSFFP